MFIDESLLSKLEKLAMIKIPDNNKESFRKELNQIIEKMNILQDIETDSDLSIQSHGTLLRDDVPINSNIAKLILNQAPDSQDGYFIVPKIIE
ncbi:Asp-tRNA(Asn)/Glu-tRNA(Gln) amidotransferase subunit GatC [Helicobacter muridarum]|uniref:Aspartyl/glutamyl-tRNA(Asn/Gln) amidotransferase subunit C n=1 Tax=Helicobacter muridarum TaxID=216 RepID=A0A099U1P2_9HELI|nr:Asp-tRNA(Asn)/Glu-tRNA(Gln) amidotransferase subunit GatC [Helicobacter muridarum]TLE00758.1 Asp-tRNA(Asn)/Glu-tRNA(Gln) amidotransferase subunit GatC [Helicobacter muridarum]STQ86562.1 glutamyl-tRNA(Gln) amidotransferase subunit C [Helicobacter muridarum]